MTTRPIFYWPLIMVFFLALFANREGLDVFLVCVGFFLIPLGYLIGLIAEVRLSKKFPEKYVAPRNFLVQVAMLLLVMASAFAGGAYVDSKTEKSPSVTILQEAPIYKDTRKSAQIGSVMPSDKFAILNVDAPKEGTAIQIQLENGTKGWVFVSPQVQLTNPR